MVESIWAIWPVNYVTKKKLITEKVLNYLTEAKWNAKISWSMAQFIVYKLGFKQESFKLQMNKCMHFHNDDIGIYF